MEFLIFSEKDDGAFELLPKAKELGGKANAVVFGDNAAERAKKYISHGAETVYIDPAHREISAVRTSAALMQVVKQTGIGNVLIYSTKRGREIAAMLSQKLDCGCVTDAIDIRVSGGGLETDRYTLGGNTITTEAITSPMRVISVMPYAFPKKEPNPGNAGNVQELKLSLPEEKTKVTGRMEKKGETVRIEDADVLLCVGKGFQKKEDLKLAYDFAAAVKAEIGVTRQLATDFGWFAEDRIVGLSGRKSSPKLYFSVGISGQIQHTVGIMRSKTIVCINKNADAPIFKISDYGIVGDLYKVLPKLTEKIKGAMG